MNNINLTTTIMVLIPLAILISGLTYSEYVSAICQGFEGNNISCHEQYNSHSNVENSDNKPTTSSDREGVGHSYLCSDLKCNFGKEYILVPDLDIVEDKIDKLDY